MHIQLGILNVREIIDVYCMYENCMIFFNFLSMHYYLWARIIEHKNVARRN